MDGYKLFKSSPFVPLYLAATSQYSFDDASASEAATSEETLEVNPSNIELYTRGKRYKIGVEYVVDGNIIVGSHGFHFYDEPIKCYEFYGNSTFAVMCKIEATGIVIGKKDLKCTNKYKIIEVLEGHHIINGVSYEFYRGGLHSHTGPALVTKNAKTWFCNGLLHRTITNGPAREYTNGEKEWWQYGTIIRSVI